MICFTAFAGPQIIGRTETKDRKWEAITKHAMTCVPGDKVYAYRTVHGAIYVNSIFDVLKVEIDGAAQPVHQMDAAQTVSQTIDTCACVCK